MKFAKIFPKYIKNTAKSKKFFKFLSEIDNKQYDKFIDFINYKSGDKSNIEKKEANIGTIENSEKKSDEMTPVFAEVVKSSNNVA